MTTKVFQDSPLSLEAEHLQLKNLLFDKLFWHMTRVLASVLVVDIIRGVLCRNFTIVLNSIIVLGLTGVIMMTKDKMQEKRHFFIIIFYIICYFGLLAANYYGESDFFKNPFNTFYLAYTLGFWERQISSRMPLLSYKILYSFLTAVIRIIMIPSDDKGIFLIHIFCLCFGLYTEFEQEKFNQKLFRSYYSSKDQLVKFKDLVVNDIPAGILIVTQDLKYSLFVNRLYNELLGSQNSSSIKNQLDRFIVQEVNKSSQTLRTLWTFLESNMTRFSEKLSCNLSYTMPILERDQHKTQKQSYLFETKIFPLMWDEQNSIAIVFHDITQQRAILNLEGANAQKDAVLATVSHELRTPLNGMLGMIQIMQKNIVDPKMPYYLDICRKNGTLLLSLVNSILDLNQIRANKLKLNPEKIDLKELLNDIVSLFEFQCTQKGIFIKSNMIIAPNRIPSLSIHTDKNRLSQILINLTGNAVKFTSKGGIILSTTILDEEYIRFSIEDTGIGIKEEDKGKLFQKFGKLDQEDSQINQQGVGLGLTISNNLSNLLCNKEEVGGIKLQSYYGKGSIFSFIINRNLKYPCNSKASTESVNEDIENRLKIHSTRATKNIMSITSSPMIQKIKSFETSFISNKSMSFINKDSVCFSESKKMGPKCSVLVVDDNPFNITVAECLVSSQGYKVKTAVSGQKAIDLVLNNNHLQDPIKLILMDCQMPGMDGYETTKILRFMMEERKIPEIPIISLTAADSEYERILCKKAGMCDHLSKPLKDSDLQTIIKKYMI